MARINYYEFPENTPVEVLAQNGCELRFAAGVVVTFRDGIEYTLNEETTFYPHEENNYGKEEIEKWGHLFIGANRCLGGLKVTTVKNLMKQYGGIGWTEHCDRDGGVFEVTEIRIKGNNSKFKYNVHL